MDRGTGSSGGSPRHSRALLTAPAREEGSRGAAGGSPRHQAPSRGGVF